MQDAARCTFNAGDIQGAHGKKIGIPEEVWIKYENGGVRIPESLMLKIYMFGLDF